MRSILISIVYFRPQFSEIQWFPCYTGNPGLRKVPTVSKCCFVSRLAASNTITETGISFLIRNRFREAEWLF